MHKIKVAPLIKIVLSFIVIIFVGFALFMLPFSTHDGIAWYDALFTSFSAVCVTGLSPVANISETFTVFGIIVLGLLIQVGGLGFVTIAVFIMRILGTKIGFNDRALVKEALNQSTQTGVIKLVVSIIRTTLILEGVAFILNLFVFIPDFGVKGIGISLFHAVSTFNNAGFDLLGDSSLIAYADNPFLVITTSIFITLGGLGFIVIHEVCRKRSWKNLSLHSKIVIKMTAFLIISGTLLFKFSESLTSEITWLEAFFQSVTARTAGFATISFGAVNGITILIMLVYMFIGASPSSTGGGVKTTTIYTMYKTIVSYSKGKKPIVYDREVSKQSIHKAFMLCFLGVTCITLFTLTILTIEILFKVKLQGLQLNEVTAGQIALQNILFEVGSAFGTVGLSTGITSGLEPLSKVVMCLVMFLGRLGPLTIFSILNRNYNKPSDGEVEYLEHEMLIG
ncbi:MAG: potassium transporter TrkG [bacterium]